MGTEGEEVNTGRTKKKKSIFNFKNDVVPDETDSEQKLMVEVKHYQTITMTKEQKEDTNILKWWKCNRGLFPNLFKLVKVYLHIPATSVPSERIFSLAGYIVRSRRSNILPDKVNKYIFLKKNNDHIPPKTKVLGGK